MQQKAVHNYLDTPDLPERCVLQLHWYREPNFQDFLSKHQFHVISIARHPLDILISVLHFIRYEPETAKWLGGNCAIPENLAGRSPASQEFLEYAISFGGENLLSVTYQWWHDQSAIKIRYEDLVAAPADAMGIICERLQVSSARIPDTVASNSFERFKVLPNRHGWQGRPGLWRELIPFQSASKIFVRHQVIFEKLGYEVSPTLLTHETAETNWTGLLR